MTLGVGSLILFAWFLFCLSGFFSSFVISLCLHVSSLLAWLFLHWRVFFFIVMFFFICVVSFLFACQFLLCLHGSFFICVFSFLFAWFLLCLQRVPCGPL